MKTLLSLIAFAVFLCIDAAIETDRGINGRLGRRQDASLCQENCGVVWGSNQSCNTLECDCALLTNNGSASTCANCLMSIGGNGTLASTINQLVAACLQSSSSLSATTTDPCSIGNSLTFRSIKACSMSASGSTGSATLETNFNSLVSKTGMTMSSMALQAKYLHSYQIITHILLSLFYLIF